MRFYDRCDAGHVLAGALRPFADGSWLFALLRGGVPVACAVAHDLRLRLEPLSVRKLGVPGHEELAFGAISPTGAVFNRSVVERARISDAAVRDAVERERSRLGQASRDVPSPPDAKTRAIVIDDGIATGASMLAAADVLSARGWRSLIAAAPVGARESCAALAERFDAVVCPLQPEEFAAVGVWYDDFTQVDETEMRRLLECVRNEVRP